MTGRDKRIRGKAEEGEEERWLQEVKTKDRPEDVLQL